MSDYWLTAVHCNCHARKHCTTMDCSGKMSHPWRHFADNREQWHHYSVNRLMWRTDPHNSCIQSSSMPSNWPCTWECCCCYRHSNFAALVCGCSRFPNTICSSFDLRCDTSPHPIRSVHSHNLDESARLRHSRWCDSILFLPESIDIFCAYTRRHSSYNLHQYPWRIRSNIHRQPASDYSSRVDRFGMTANTMYYNLRRYQASRLSHNLVLPYDLPREWSNGLCSQQWCVYKRYDPRRCPPCNSHHPSNCNRGTTEVFPIGLHHCCSYELHTFHIEPHSGCKIVCLRWFRYLRSSLGMPKPRL